MRKTLLTAIPAMLVLGACAGFPEARSPVVLPAAVPIAPDAGSLSAGGAWPDAEWWHRYQDPTLDALIAAVAKSVERLRKLAPAYA